MISTTFGAVSGFAVWAILCAAIGDCRLPLDASMRLFFESQNQPIAYRRQ